MSSIVTDNQGPRQCEGKRGYRRKTDAKRAARWAQANFRGGALHAYRCGRCGWFHVGHKAASQPKDTTNDFQEETTGNGANDEDGRLQSSPQTVESPTGTRAGIESVGESTLAARASAEDHAQAS
jgi:hypothetical protein